MTDKELDSGHFRTLLLELERSLKEVAATGEDAASTVELDQTRVGRLSRMDAMQAQAMSQATNQRRTAALAAIKAALGRLDRDEYGYCEGCGEQIDPRRLEFNPAAACCVHCAA